MNDKEKEGLISQYCGNKMKQLREICDPIIRINECSVVRI